MRIYNQKLIINLWRKWLHRKHTHVEKSDSCQYLQTAEYCAICKQGAMPVLDNWYQAESWRATGIVQPQS